MKQPLSQTEKFKRQFKNELSKSTTPPFLFIGSGFSIRYYNIPTWLNLLESFVQEHSKAFSHAFGYYSAKEGRNPIAIAANLASEFHESWWTLDKFNENREKYHSIAGMSQEIALKIELCEFIRKKMNVNENLKEEINLLKKATLSGIMTTNWDDFLQNIFNEFQAKIGQKEVIFSDQHPIGDIYKIHGCITQPESLVLTQSDYELFDRNNHYLKSKILTLFVDFPILFIGYSLSDPNITTILRNIVECLDNDYLKIEKLHDRLFFVEWQANPCDPSLESSTYSLDSGSIPIKKIRAHTYEPIFEVLAELPRKLPITILKQLQNMVYDFVMTSEPSQKILVKGLDQLDNIENLEVVVGFGNISKLQDKGITGLEDLELLEDILFDTISLSNYQEIVEILLPKRIRKNVYLPFFKYNHYINNLNPDNSLKAFKNSNFVLERAQNISLEDYRSPSQSGIYRKQTSGFKSLKELIESSDIDHAVQRIPYYDLCASDTLILKDYLKSYWKSEELNPSYFTHYRKCICILDFLMYANNS